MSLIMGLYSQYEWDKIVPYLKHWHEQLCPIGKNPMTIKCTIKTALPNGKEQAEQQLYDLANVMAHMGEKSPESGYPIVGYDVPNLAQQLSLLKSVITPFHAAIREDDAVLMAEWLSCISDNITLDSIMLPLKNPQHDISMQYQNMPLSFYLTFNDCPKITYYFVEKGLTPNKQYLDVTSSTLKQITHFESGVRAGHDGSLKALMASRLPISFSNTLLFYLIIKQPGKDKAPLENLLELGLTAEQTEHSDDLFISALKYHQARIADLLFKHGFEFPEVMRQSLWHALLQALESRDVMQVLSQCGIFEKQFIDVDGSRKTWLELALKEDLLIESYGLILLGADVSDGNIEAALVDNPDLLTHYHLPELVKILKEDNLEAFKKCIESEHFFARVKIPIPYNYADQYIGLADCPYTNLLCFAAIHQSIKIVTYVLDTFKLEDLKHYYDADLDDLSQPVPGAQIGAIESGSQTIISHIVDGLFSLNLSEETLRQHVELLICHCQFMFQFDSLLFLMNKLDSLNFKPGRAAKRYEFKLEECCLNPDDFTSEHIAALQSDQFAPYLDEWFKKKNSNLYSEALDQNQMDILRFLFEYPSFEKNQMIAMSSNERLTAFGINPQACSLEMFKFLVQNGVHFNKPNLMPVDSLSGAEQKSEFVASMTLYLEHDRADIVEYVIDNQIELNHPLIKKDWTIDRIVSEAIKKGAQSTIAMLIDKGFVKFDTAKKKSWLLEKWLKSGNEGFEFIASLLGEPLPRSLPYENNQVPLMYMGVALGAPVAFLEDLLHRGINAHDTVTKGKLLKGDNALNKATDELIGMLVPDTGSNYETQQFLSIRYQDYIKFLLCAGPSPAKNVLACLSKICDYKAKLKHTYARDTMFMVEGLLIDHINTYRLKPKDSLQSFEPSQVQAKLQWKLAISRTWFGPKTSSDHDNHHQTHPKRAKITHEKSKGQSKEPEQSHKRPAFKLNARLKPLVDRKFLAVSGQLSELDEFLSRYQPSLDIEEFNNKLRQRDSIQADMERQINDLKSQIDQANQDQKALNEHKAFEQQVANICQALNIRISVIQATLPIEQDVDELLSKLQRLSLSLESKEQALTERERKTVYIEEQIQKVFQAVQDNQARLEEEAQLKLLEKVEAEKLYQLIENRSKIIDSIKATIDIVKSNVQALTASGQRIDYGRAKSIQEVEDAYQACLASIDLTDHSRDLQGLEVQIGSLYNLKKVALRSQSAIKLDVDREMARIPTELDEVERQMKAIYGAMQNVRATFRQQNQSVTHVITERDKASVIQMSKEADNILVNLKHAKRKEHHTLSQLNDSSQRYHVLLYQMEDVSKRWQAHYESLANRCRSYEKEGQLAVPMLQLAQKKRPPQRKLEADVDLTWPIREKGQLFANLVSNDVSDSDAFTCRMLEIRALVVQFCELDNFQNIDMVRRIRNKISHYPYLYHDQYNTYLVDLATKFANFAHYGSEFDFSCLGVLMLPPNSQSKEHDKEFVLSHYDELYAQRLEQFLMVSTYAATHKQVVETNYPHAVTMALGELLEIAKFKDNLPKERNDYIRQIRNTIMHMKGDEAYKQLELDKWLEVLPEPKKQHLALKI